MTDPIEGVLAQARDLGFLGPGPIATQRDHALAFLTALHGWDEGVALDLGSGGGLPGLVLACALPRTTWVLLDAMRRRTSFLEEAVARLAIDDRVRVVTSRAEEAARTPELREAFDVVVTRGFGPPPVTAECAAPFLRPGGVLIVSEPPGSSGERWPADGVAAAALELERVIAGPPALVRLRRHGALPVHLPRRVGVPAKRPLW
jgi:16S rRNA (guanine527-N7)-methyltransferase